MARVKQFANDLGISKNQAQTLINKGRSRKDGGSQILEKMMKPKEYKLGGTNPKAPVAKVKKTKLKKIVKKKDPFRADKTESLDKEFSKSVAKANEKAIKEIKKSIGGLQEIPEDNKGLQALAKKAPKVVERMGFKKMRGGGIAIQGTGFRGVK